jgi:thiamine biosynthesis protein ThiS
MLGFAVQRVAAELNGMVVRRGQWAETLLNEGDKIEIVHFVGGGALSFCFFNSGCRV